jgi:hypothetical protein
MIRTYDHYGYGFEPIQLYDMVTDPYQTQNLADTQPHLVSQCDRLMTEWVHQQLAKDGWRPDPLLEILRERQAPS